MQPPRLPAVDTALTFESAVRVAGRRAVIEFTPSLTTIERLCAGVVIQTTEGVTHYRSAIDPQKAEHAFGSAGLSLAAVAHRLCKSLAEHWWSFAEKAWVPPFEGAAIARLSDFTASSADAAMEFALRQHSSLAMLLAAHEVPAYERGTSILHRVRTQIRREPRLKHLAPRFSRPIDLGAEAGPLRIDFLGQNLVCFFISLTQSERGIDATTDRAFGKLFELQAVRRFVSSRPKAIGLLEDERPHQFELLAVGDRTGSIQHRALSRIEAVADQGEVIVRPLPDVAAAVHHVGHAEAVARART